MINCIFNRLFSLFFLKLFAFYFNLIICIERREINILLERREGEGKKMSKRKRGKEKESTSKSIPRKKSKNPSSIIDCLPNELHVIILEFFLSTSDDWRSDWIKISLVSKKWNSLSFMAFYKTFPIHAITWASEYGHFDVVERLLKNTKYEDADPYFYAIKCAQHGRHKDIYQLLLNDKRMRFDNTLQLYHFSCDNEPFAEKVPEEGVPRLISPTKNFWLNDDLTHRYNLSIEFRYQIKENICIFI